MGKLDDLRAKGGAHVLASMGGGAGPELPAGLDPRAASRKPARLEGLTRDQSAARIEVGRIIPDPDQPRREFDPEELEHLAKSIRDRGQIQPVRVRWDEKADEGRGMYVVLAGERRWRAARMAGLTEVACTVHEGELSEADRLALQLIENAVRVDLKPIEQARAFRRLMVAQEWSARHLASELAISPATVVRALALLDLPAEVQGRVEQGALSPAAAYEVSKLDDPAEQAIVAEAAVDQKLTRGEAAELVQAVKAKRAARPAKPAPFEVDLGDGVTVLVRYRRASQMTGLQALRKALRVAQDRERTSEPEAA